MASRARLIAACALVQLAWVVGLARAQTPAFHLVGSAMAGGGSRVEGLSADGRVAGGTSFGFGGNPGFTWTAENGRNDFGLETGLPSTTAVFAVSGSGSVVAGRTYLAGGAMRAFRYAGPGTYQELGTILSYPESMARGMNGDGSVVVGQVHGAGSQAFRWTQAGMQGLGYARPWHSNSSAAAISRDGTTIVGGSGDGSTGDAFAWRVETGMLPLPSLPGAYKAGAHAVNFDGSIIVGRSDKTTGSYPTMWRDGQAIDLGFGTGISFNWRAEPLGLNDAGTVVVGWASVFTSDPTAVVWTPATGWEILSDYLTRNGVAVPQGWTLYWASCVSADGLTIGGWAIPSGGGDMQGFVATIPSPGVSMTLAPYFLWNVRRNRRSVTSASPLAGAGGDGAGLVCLFP